MVKSLTHQNSAIDFLNVSLLICSYDRFLKSLKRDLVLHASGIIITHPFQVISIRMMAQFVGRETIYKYALTF